METRNDVQTLYISLSPGASLTITHPQTPSLKLPLTQERIEEKLGRGHTNASIERLRDQEWVLFPEFSGYGLLLRRLRTAEDDGLVHVIGGMPNE